MTKIMRIEFRPEHLLAIKVDPIVLKLREGIDLIEWAKIRKRMGTTVSMVAINVDKSTRVVASGGAVVLWPGTGELWMALDIDGGKMPALPIAIRSQVDEWIETLNLDRIHSTVPATWPPGIRFLEWIGMEKESLMRKFGPGRIDQFMYARVK